MNLFKRMLGFWRNRSEPVYPTIRTHVDRIEIDCVGADPVVVPWSEVTAIITYKEDLIALDAIIVEFTLASQPEPSPLRPPYVTS